MNNFKGFHYYGITINSIGDIELTDYSDILSARRARADLFMDQVSQDNPYLKKIDEALSQKFEGNMEVLDEVYKEDKAIAEEEQNVFYVLNNIANIANIDSKDLVYASLILSDLSFVEENIISNKNKGSELFGLKELFHVSKAHSKIDTEKEHKDLVEYIEKMNSIIMEELNNRAHSSENNINLRDKNVIDMSNKPADD